MPMHCASAPMHDDSPDCESSQHTSPAAHGPGAKKHTTPSGSPEPVSVEPESALEDPEPPESALEDPESALDDPSVVVIDVDTVVLVSEPLADELDPPSVIDVEIVVSSIDVLSLLESSPPQPSTPATTTTSPTHRIVIPPSKPVYETRRPKPTRSQTKL